MQQTQNHHHTRHNPHASRMLQRSAAYLLAQGAHPDRKLAQAMLASIAATDGAPTRVAVLAAVAEKLKG